MTPAVLMPADIRFPLERANGVQIVKTAAALARAGAQTTLVVRDSDPRPTDEVLALYGVQPEAALAVRRMRVRHRTGAHHLPRALFLLKALSASARAAQRGAVVFTRDLQLAELLLHLPGRARVVYEAHAVESIMYRERGTLYGTAERAQEAKAGRLFRREERVWRGAGGFVTTTAGIRDTFRETYGARERVAVVPNGCDVPAERAFPGLSEETVPRVLYAGQLYPWKGVDVLVAAMAQVPGARLVIVGGLTGEKDLDRVRALVAQHGLEGRTEMTGTLPQVAVAEQVARAAVVAVPFLRSAMTERHTSPLKAFEAMAAGRPIVITDVPSTREVLTDGESALFVPSGDADALAAAIRRLLQDRALAIRLAARAYADAARFSWDARARELLNLFETVAA